MSITIPTIQVTGKTAQLISEWIDANKMEEAAAEKRKHAESQIIGKAQIARIDKCRQDGIIYSQIILDGGKAGTITMVQNQRYQMIKVDIAQDQLISIFGKDQFEEYFQVKTTISIDLDKLTDTQADRIARALGDDAIEVFGIESVIMPTEKYSRDRILDKRIAKKAAQAEEEGLVIPFTPCIRRPELGILTGGPIKDISILCRRVRGRS